MSAPVYVTFRHVAPRAELEEYAREQAGRLERLYARIADCRVLLERTGPDALRVVVELSVPGERLVASHESAPDADATADAEDRTIAEYRWLHALHTAFEEAGRILQEFAGRRQPGARPALRAMHR
jgi:hypothetical protein